jgi:membrane protease YdiL (CAAX protease family)
MDRRTPRRLLEIAAALGLWFFGQTIVLDAAAIVHLPLPEMPLVKHAYLLFSFVLLICLYIYLRGESFADFGLKWPERVWLQIGRGVLVLAATLVFDIVGRPFLDPLVASLTHTSPTLAEQHFVALKGNFGLFLALVPVALVFGGFGEEFLFRGFLLTRIAQMLGESRWAWGVAVVLQAIPFALGHAYQGPVGIAGIFIVALIDGTAAILWGRNLWPVMIGHGLLDIFAFFAMYSGIAHA